MFRWMIFALAIVGAAGAVAAVADEAQTQPQQKASAEAEARRERLRKALWDLGSEDVPTSKAAAGRLAKVRLLRARFRTDDPAGLHLPPHTRSDSKLNERYSETFLVLTRAEDGPAPQEWARKVLAIRDAGFVLHDAAFLNADELAEQREHLLRRASTRPRPEVIVSQAKRAWEREKRKIVKRIAGYQAILGETLEQMGCEKAREPVRIEDFEAPLRVLAGGDDSILLAGPVTLPIDDKKSLYTVHLSEGNRTGAGGGDWEDLLHDFELFIHEHPDAVLLAGDLPPWYDAEPDETKDKDKQKPKDTVAEE